MKQRHLWMERRQLPTPAPNLPPPGCPPAAGLRRPDAARMGAAESRAVAAPLRGRAALAGPRALTVSPPAAESRAAPPVARRGPRRNRAARRPRQLWEERGAELSGSVPIRKRPAQE